jgi:hypothetical protein
MKASIMKWKYLLGLIILCFIVSNCKKDNSQAPSFHETKILSYSIQNISAIVNIDTTQHLINIRFPDQVMNGDSLIANFTLSQGCKATIKNVEQLSGVSKNNFTNVFIYTISYSGYQTDWTVTTTNNNYTSILGMGNFLQLQASNNCNFPWYKDQAYTGPFSQDNCGPTAVTMVCKWADSTFTKTTEDARNAYRSTGGLWYPDDITFYLRDNAIPNSTIQLPLTEEGTTQAIKRQIDLQQIVIVDLEMFTVRFNSDQNSHVDRFYLTDAGRGHYIIVKGYKKVDNQIFFEVYDPNSWTAIYADGNLKGKDRFYRSSDIFQATKTWWPKVFIVAKKGTTVIE